MRVVAVVQARLQSSRLPGKVLLPAPDGRPLLNVLFARVKRASLVDEVVLATTCDPLDRLLSAWADACGVTTVVTVEDPNDVLQRYWYAAEYLTDADLIVRLTGDNPLVMPEVINLCVGVAVVEGYQYVRTGESYPEGLDVEVLTVGALRRVHAAASLPCEREHVTYALREEAHRLELPEPLGHLRVTVDEPEDYSVVYDVLSELGPAGTLTDLLRLARRRPSLFERNAHVERNEGLRRSLEAAQHEREAMQDG